MLVLHRQDREEQNVSRSQTTREEQDARSLQIGPENHKMAVAYKHRGKQRDASSLQDMEQDNASCLQTRQGTTRCWFLSCLQTTQRITRCEFFSGRTESNEMLVPYRQDRTTKCKLLANNTGNNKMLVAYRQHREQQDASSYQTGQRTTKC